MDCAIVPITDELIPGFHAVLDEVAREKRYLSILEAPPLDKTTAWVQADVRRGFPHFVALDGPRVIGWCDLSPIDRPVHAHCGVLGIGILGAYRGKGIGRGLMLATLEQARAIGLTRIELTVRERNLKATALYENLGFRREGRMLNAVRIDGSYENLLSMALLFDAPAGAMR